MRVAAKQMAQVAGIVRTWLLNSMRAANI